jgi:hypothetical protein
VLLSSKKIDIEAKKVLFANDEAKKKPSDDDMPC